MTQVPYGLTLPQTEEEIELNRKSWLHPPHQNPPLPLLYEDYYQQFYYYTIPIENKLELYTKGYTVLHNIIPKELIQAAIEKINDHILQTDLYFDVLHNEKYYSNSSSKKEKEKQKQQQHQQMMMKKKEGTFAENPFIGNPEKQKIRLENRKLQRDEDPYFISGTSNDLAILSLYYATPVHAMVESLLHGNPSKYSEQVLLKQPSAAPAKQASSLKHSDEIRRPFRIATGGGQIAYRFTQPINHQARSETLLTMRMSHSAKSPPLATLEQKDKSKKASASFYNTLKSNDPILNKRYPPIGGNSWHIDGLGRGQWGTFSFLIGVPLNDQFDEYSGNLCLHDGSHYLLQSYLKQYANRFNAADSFEEKYRLAKDIEKPNLGEPTQILASAGDVIIALHKVAHLGGPNYGTEVRKMVYFRVSHQRHQELRFNALDDLWIEYEGMDDVLPK